MLRSVMCIKWINHYLHPDRDLIRQISTENPRTFLIHESIIQKFKIRLASLGFLNFDQSTFDFPLRVGGKLFPMKLVWITVSTEQQIQFLTEIIDLASSSFFWESHASIYDITLKFNRITNFEYIQDFNLSSSIDRVDHQTLISMDKSEITVLHFKSSVPKSIEHDFKRFCSTSYTQPEDPQYYVMSAFEFLKPRNLKYFDEHTGVPGTLLSMVLYLILDYHRMQKRRQNYETFNLIDLCSIKLAFDDPRCENESCEVLALIAETLLEMQSARYYIKSGTLDLQLYGINYGIEHISTNILQYLVYRFNMLFTNIIYFDIANVGFNPNMIKIRLADITIMDNLIKFIAERSTASVKIDGLNFSRMGGDLLTRLIRLGAHEITLDTSYEWISVHSDEINYKVTDDLVDHVELIFKNRNSGNFVENCLNWIKTWLNQSINSWTLIFEGSEIKFPFILNNLTVKKIIVKRMRLSSKILKFLNRCRATRIISDCKLDMKTNTIEALENVEFTKETCVQIVEEPHTFGLILKYVEEYLQAHKKREYQFKCGMLIKNIFLDRFKFILNAFEDQIDIVDIETNTIIDLYLFKEFNHRFCEGNKEDFDFYQ